MSIDFKEVYRPPFRLNDFIVWADSGICAFDFSDEIFCDSGDRYLSKEEKSQAIDILNGSKDRLFRIEGLYYRDGKLYDSEDKRVLTFRGWKHLSRCMKLSPEEIYEVQDNFGRWFVYKLGR